MLRLSQLVLALEHLAHSLPTLALVERHREVLWELRHDLVLRYFHYSMHHYSMHHLNQVCMF
jgi:hypothetical protein